MQQSVTLFTDKFVLCCPRQALQSSAAELIPELAAWHATLQPFVCRVHVLLATSWAADGHVIWLHLSFSTSWRCCDPRCSFPSFSDSGIAGCNKIHYAL